MTVVFESSEVTLHHGDCLDVLASLPDSSVDSVVTDPPYGLANTDPAHVAETITRWVNGERDYLPGGTGFMGKSWDAFVPPVAVWDECLRVLKPGGHLLAFAGSRTMDLMTLGLRLAGFEIRDSIAWLYGSGFPKSMDISKAIDKAAGAEREVIGSKIGLPGYSLAPSTGGNLYAGSFGGTGDPSKEAEITAPATDAARTWQGWGTALKPAFEPVVVARKPLHGTVAGNVLKYGTGALNIDGARIGRAAGDRTEYGRGNHLPHANTTASLGKFAEVTPYEPNASGRFPANVILDESQATELDKQSGTSTSNVRPPTGRDDRGVPNTAAQMVMRRNDNTQRGHADSGGASRYFKIIKEDACATDLATAPTTTATGAEGATPAPSTTANAAPPAAASGASTDGTAFYYTAKADSGERPVVNGIAHPTVKPLDLMRYLVRLVTAKGGTVLEPFAGSGTTLEAAVLEGFRAIGIEREADYIPLVEQRLDKPHEVGLDLFGDVA